MVSGALGETLHFIHGLKLNAILSFIHKLIYACYKVSCIHDNKYQRIYESNLEL